MPLPDSPVVRSVRRSRARLKVLLALARKREAYVAELSRATGLRDHRVRAALEGHDGTYRPQLSLVGLGLATSAVTEQGIVFRATPFCVELAPRLARSMRVDPLVREFSDLARMRTEP